MSNHTPGPWKFETVQTSVGICHKIGPFPWKNGKENAACLYVDYAGGGPIEAELLANARLIAAAPELLEALESYRLAKDMSSYGDYAEIAYEQPLRTFDASYGGGDCAKHGRYYGRCHCCSDEWDRLKKQSDRDAVHARDNALRVADDLARAAIAKARGEST